MQLSTAFLLLVGLFHRFGDVGATRGQSNSDVERELTFEISAGKEECFYETVQQGNVIDIEYQVRI